MTKGIPTDPGVAAQWHLNGTWGLNAQKIWPDYTGKGVLVGILDDGFDYLHTELNLNFRTDLDLDTLGNDNDSYVAAADKHGTAVAGIIGADDNGQGGVGVAFDAGLVGIRQGYGAQSNMSNTLDAFNFARTANLDVLNNSWGFSNAFSDNSRLEFTGTDIYQLTGAMADMTSYGRNGLGTNIVFSAGNGRANGDNTNYHNFQNSIHSITVGAIKEDGTFASFSTKGASILVSAGGTSLSTTDVSGTGGYVSGDYTTFSGTSASAPVVSGMVALMLEANKNLGWRDVQEILVYSAKHNDAASAGWQKNDATNWNGGGLYFSHDYGFGAADAHAAVRLAETWTLKQTTSNMVTTAAFNAAPSLPIPAAGTITTTINVTQNIEIEHVLVKLDIDHTKAGDLVVTLVAPDGTKSVLADHIGNGNFISSAYGISGIHFDMSSNAHWGERSQGVWTLEINDTVGGNSGVLNSWGVQFTGNNHSADDTYIYTDDFFTLNTGAVRQILSDTDGGIDTLNFSAIEGRNVTVTLMDNNPWSVNFRDSSGTQYQADIDIADGTIIENVYTGDGMDYVQGNQANNYINTGRNDDNLCVSMGDDILDGGTGFDTGTLYRSIAEYSCRIIDAITAEFTHMMTVGQTNYGKDTFINVERFEFLEGYYTFADIQNYFAGLVTPPPVNPAIGLYFSNGSKAFNYSSSVNEVKALTAKDMGISTSTAQYVKLERTDTEIKINYLSSSAPGTLRVDGGDAGERITISGSRTGLAAEVNGGGGDDVIVLGLAGTALFRGGNGNDTITGNSKKDVLYGDAGNDVLTGAADHDALYGGDGNDTLNGDAGDDKLYGDAGNDTLNGGLGVDTFFGGSGADVLNGGDGNDILDGEDGDDTVNGDAGDDRLYGRAGNDVMNGGLGVDYIYGGAGADILRGGDGNDTLAGDEDDDTLYGDAGNDKVNGGTGNDVLNGGIGADTLYGDDDIDTLNGDAGADKLYGGNGADILNGGADNDSLYGGTGNDFANGDDGADTVYGEDGDDTVTGGLGADKLYGDAGNDVLSGGADADKVWGGAGNDTLNGNDGSDYLYGEAGNDTMYGGAGSDSMYGDAGDDNLYGGDGNDALTGGIDNDTLSGDAGDDNLYGEAGNDRLNGGDGRDRLVGAAGDDLLRGGAGDDTLYGDTGNDLLIGDVGKDNLYGGTGNDIFAFTSLDGVDAVRDFAIGDRLNISDILTGFSGSVNDLLFFVKVTGTSTKTFSINADGIGNDFVQAFTVTNLNGTVQDMFNNGILITNNPIV